MKRYNSSIFSSIIETRTMCVCIVNELYILRSCNVSFGVCSALSVKELEIENFYSSWVTISWTDVLESLTLPRYEICIYARDINSFCVLYAVCYYYFTTIRRSRYSWE